MKIELNISIDLMNDNGKPIKKNIITKHLVDTEEIKNPQEIFNSRGTIVKNRCKIFVKDIGPIIVNHSYKYIKELIGSKEIKGFKR